MMNMNVHVEQPVMLKPPVSGEETRLYLQNLEQQVFFPVEMLFVYTGTGGDLSSTGDVIDVIREAVREVLVPYYFVAGRMHVNEDQGRVELVCNGAGVLFAGAVCENTLSDFDGLRQSSPELRKLLVYPADRSDTSISSVPLVTIQVTRFSCGGFVFGISACHAIFDGSAGYEFYNSIAQAARGEKLTDLRPNPDRSSLRAKQPPVPTLDHPELVAMPDVPAKLMFKPTLYDPNDPAAAPNFAFKLFSFSPAMLNTLKLAALEDGALTRCSSFEALTAHIWRARTRAMGYSDTSKVSKLFVVVNVRHKVKSPPLPEQFCGNAVVACACVKTTVDEMTKNPFSFCVRKVQEIIRCASEEYLRSAIDWCELNHGNINVPGGLIVTPWSKLPFHEVDFGWGKPSYVVPAVHDRAEYVIVLSNCKGDGGVDAFMGMEVGKLAKLDEYLNDLYL